MAVWQALLCGILYWLAEANVPYITIWTVQKPLVCGWLTGCIIGAPLEGAFCGALISLLYIGHKSQGSSMPADIALAGICAAASCCAGVAAGVSVFYALPAGLFGILIWKLRLFMNARFMNRAEKAITKGQTWAILVPAVLIPVLFSAAVCIPIGAIFSVVSFSSARMLIASSLITILVAHGLALVGLVLCAAGLVLPLFPIREWRHATSFIIGVLSVLILRVPLLWLALPAVLFSYIAARAMEKALAASSNESADPDLVSGLAPDWDPDLDCDEAASKKSADTLRSTPIPHSRQVLTACSLLWILFVQAAYNTKLMMGQAAAVAFVPVAKALYPNDPELQQQLLQRQCVYLNTQPELGSCLIGRLAAMEAQEDAPAQIRSVRSSLMGVFGALGDELFQCGWIPLLLLLASDLVLYGGHIGSSVLFYIGTAVISAALLSAVSFQAGFSHDEMQILDLLESGVFHRIRHTLDLLLPFFQGAALGTLALQVVLPAVLAL